MSVLPINTGGYIQPGQIRVTNTSQKYGTHVSHMGAGGFTELPSLTYRNSIPVETDMKEDGFTSGRRKFGMIVYSIQDKKYYQLRPKSSGTEITFLQWNEAPNAQKVVWLDPTQTRDDPDFFPVYGSGNPAEAWTEVFAPLSINNNTNNYILTATGNSGSINGEQNFTFDGTTLILTGSLSVSGSVNAQSFYQDSSRTLKTNIIPFETSAINLLDNVNVVEFNYLNDLLMT
jgi:hypothetical protein